MLRMQLRKNCNIITFTLILAAIATSHFLSDNEAQWKCTEKQCEFKTTNAAVRKMLAVVQSEIDQLDALEPGSQAIEAREAALRKVFRSLFSTGKKKRKYVNFLVITTTTKNVLI